MLMMQASIISCSCGNAGGGFCLFAGFFGDTKAKASLKAMNGSVRAAARTLCVNRENAQSPLHMLAPSAD